MISREGVSVTVEESIDAETYDALGDMSGATIYHTRAWHKVLSRTCGWKVSGLVARDDRGQVCWYLPVVRKRRLGVRNLCVCLPLSDRIGPAVRAGFDSTRLPDLAEVVGALEVHESVGTKSMRRETTKVISMLDLTAFSNAKQVRASFHNASIRRKIRKAEQSGFRLQIGNCEEHFRLFESIQNSTRRRQGSPAYPREFFPTMWRELHGNGQVSLHLVFQDDRVVSGVVFLGYGSCATYGYGASVVDRSVWRLGANQLAMWSGIKAAYEAGYSNVDFGSTPVTQPDLRIYKEKWGAESEELPYSYTVSYGAPTAINRTGLLATSASALLRMLPQPVFDRVSPWLLKRVA